MFKAFQREPTFKQYSSEVFQEKLGKFYQFINDFTYIDEELNPEERQQLLQSRFTNGEDSHMFLKMYQIFDAGLGDSCPLAPRIKQFSLCY